MISIQYNESESTQRPAEVDETSSAHVVYLRKDIKEVEVPATDNTAASTKYVYQEAILTKEDCRVYTLAKAIAAEGLAQTQGA